MKLKANFTYHRFFTKSTMVRLSKAFLLSCSKTLTVALLFFTLSIPDVYSQETGTDLINKSLEAIGFKNKIDIVFKYQSASSELQNFQSDRSYPPYFSAFNMRENFFYPDQNLEVVHSKSIYPARGPGSARRTVNTAELSYSQRGDQWIGFPSGLLGGDISLNPVSVLMSWSKTTNIKVVGKKVFREYPRHVLERNNEGVKEYLYLDEKTFFPVKYEKTESHYLWGTVRIEYLYSTWLMTDNSYFPAASFKIVDGVKEISKTHGQMSFISSEELEKISIPDDAMMMGSLTAVEEPKAVKVSDNFYLLENRAYTSGVYFSADTLYLFDATISEERAKYDQKLIKELFPGDYPIVLIVTDLAWPHIGGFRYWVSKGASVLSHTNSKDFLTRVYERKWSAPDNLEKNRTTSPFKFSGLNSVSFIRDDIQIIPIDGIGSEGAIMVYIPEEQFLWASDYIQSLRGLTVYTKEVWDASQRVQIQPKSVAAQHLQITQWTTIEDLAKSFKK